MELGDFLLKTSLNLNNPQSLINKTSPQVNRVFHIFNKNIILNSNKNNLKRNRSITYTEIKKQLFQKKYDTKIESNYFHHIYLNDNISKLNMKYKDSLKNIIINSKKLELLQKKIRILDAKKQKIENYLCKYYELRKKEKQNQKEIINKKCFIKNYKILKGKELEEKRNKVTNLRNKEKDRLIKQKIHRKINSENLAMKKNEMKQKIIDDLTEVRRKINEENQRKRTFVKKVDEDIIKRRIEFEKKKKKIIMEQIEQEIKLQEHFNNKLIGKIKKYEKAGLKVIVKLANFNYKKI